VPAKIEQPQQKEQRLVQNEVWNHAPARAPEPCYDHVSLFYFIHRFVSPNPEDGFPGHLSFLPSLYNSHSHGLLEVATLSVAQMAAYNKFGGDKFRVQSYKNYGRAIRMLQDIIGSEEQATDDKVITSILLLCVLKDISGERHGGSSEHAPGLFYLVEKRGPEQIATSRGAELLFLSLIRLVSLTCLHTLIFLVSGVVILTPSSKSTPSSKTTTHTSIPGPSRRSGASSTPSCAPWA
jgi:hypothetical protein